MADIIPKSGLSSGRESKLKKESKVDKLEKIELYLRDETDDEEERKFDLVEVSSVRSFRLEDIKELNL